MSVAEAPAAVVRRPPRVRRPSTRFLRSELWLIFGRRRNWAGLAVLAAVPAIIAISIKIWPTTTGGGGGVNFFSGIIQNGLFVSLAALMLELPLFLPLAIAAIAADSIAGEANLGTLRYLLTVPVHRTRVLVVKYAAIVIFSFAATLLVAVVGMALGLALFGGGSATSISGTEVSFGGMLIRVLAVCGYLSIELCALGAIGIFVSSLTEQPIGATIAIMAVMVLSVILQTIPQLSAIHPYLLTTYWQSYMDLLRDPLGLTPNLQNGLLSAGAYVLVFWSAAWARFAGRDITN